jgi:malate dehydrogenase (oxaloacetate-decarboxylating)(NADP+)
MASTSTPLYKNGYSTIASLSGGAQPAQVGPQEIQVERALARLRSIPGDLEKYTFLAGLKDRNERVFYSLIGSNMSE